MKKVVLALSFILCVLLLKAQNLEDQGKGTAANGKETQREIHPLLILDGPYKPTWESLAQHKAPDWFRNDKVGFSMHWGPYAVPAWATQGAGVGPSSYSEWYWNQMNIEGSPTQKHHFENWGKDFSYDDFIPMFTTENFDADGWMWELKRNGVRYFYITSKHHDGFCLWDTKYTDRNSKKMGPKRDILRELVDAARKHHIRIGFYYSLYEWYNPAYVNELTEKTWLGTPAVQKELVKTMGYKGYKKIDNYVDDFMIPQIVELIDNFHPDYLCFDGEWDHPESYWRMKQVAAYYYNQAAKLGQEVIMNDRFGSGTRGIRGDFFHVEYFANVDKSLPWAMWRGFGKSFGHNKNEAPDAYLSPTQAVRMVVDCVAENGNIEFNVGPTMDGRIDQPEWGLIQNIGNWLKTNGEAIYNARGTPIGKLKYGRATYNPEKKSVYLHVFKWPEDGYFAVNGIKNKVQGAYLLADRSIRLGVEQTGLQLKIKAPKQAPDLHVSVIVIEYEGELEIVDYFEFKKADKMGKFILDAESATIKGKQLRLEEDKNALGFWSNQDDYPLWGIDVEKSRTYKVSIELACNQSSGGTFFLEIDGEQVGKAIKVPATANWFSFQEVSVGSLKLEKGKHKVAIKCKELNGALMNLKVIKFQLN